MIIIVSEKEDHSTSEGKPQRYLTDYNVLYDGSVILPPWEGDEDTINDFRAKIGLPLLPKNVCEAIFSGH